MAHFIKPSWQEIFQYNDLMSFDDIWALPLTWFENPNHARGGWSGVAEFQLKKPDGSHTQVFIKKQNNFFYRPWRNAFRNTPLVCREFENIKAYQAAGLPGLDVVYFDVQKKSGDTRGIIITKALEGFVSLQDILMKNLCPGAKQRALIFTKVAQAIRQMHLQNIVHNCLYPKHILLKFAGQIDTVQTLDDISVHMIDLEKIKHWPDRQKVMIRDLAAFFSRTTDITQYRKTEVLAFFKHYLAINKLDNQAKKYWQSIERELLRRNRI